MEAREAALGAQPAIRLRAERRRYGEDVVKGVLALCALISVATTVGIVVSLLVGVVVTVFASIVPALRATRIPPMAALRDGLTAIHRIHVSDRGRFGFARLDRREQRVEALGYVAPARVLGAGIGARLRELPTVDLICPARVESVQTGGERATVRLTTDDGSRDIRARLVVAADGAQSAVRAQLGIATRSWEYGQTAVVTNVTPQFDHAHVAYERFTDSGPLAVLPMGERRCAIVWTVPDGAVDEVMGLGDAGILARLQERFG